jgi:hypothetical protein
MAKATNPASFIPATPPYDKKKFTAWGNQSDVAAQQGWYPETQYGDVTVFRNPYNHAFNNVLDNGSPQDHIALLGHNNQRFDVVIRDKNNNIKKTIMQGISPSDMQQVAQRNNSILRGTNQEGRLVNSLLANK